jgi:hypothetical protein
MRAILSEEEKGEEQTVSYLRATVSTAQREGSSPGVACQTNARGFFCFSSMTPQPVEDRRPRYSPRVIRPEQIAMGKIERLVG